MLGWHLTPRRDGDCPSGDQAITQQCDGALAGQGDCQSALAAASFAQWSRHACAMLSFMAARSASFAAIRPRTAASSSSAHAGRSGSGVTPEDGLPSNGTECCVGRAAMPGSVSPGGSGAGPDTEVGARFDAVSGIPDATGSAPAAVAFAGLELASALAGCGSSGLGGTGSSTLLVIGAVGHWVSKRTPD
jgi:hypothetical protein